MVFGIVDVDRFAHIIAFANECCKLDLEIKLLAWSRNRLPVLGQHLARRPPKARPRYDDRGGTPVVGDGEAEIVVVQWLEAWSEDLAALSKAPRQQQNAREFTVYGDRSLDN